MCIRDRCFDHFQAVYRTLTDGMSYDEMVLRLVNYCRQRNRLNDLINVLLEAWPDLQDELTLSLQDVAAKTPTRMASWRDDNADSDVGNMWSLEEVLAQVRRTLDQYIPPVSYTHLDVYKRQGLDFFCMRMFNNSTTNEKAIAT